MADVWMGMAYHINHMCLSQHKHTQADDMGVAKICVHIGTDARSCGLHWPVYGHAQLWHGPPLIAGTSSGQGPK